MAHFPDKRSPDHPLWRLNGQRHIFWPHNSINFGVPNCRFLFVASTALPRCWSRQLILLCPKSLAGQRSQQHFSKKRKVWCRMDFPPLLLGISRSYGCSNVHLTHMDFISTWLLYFTFRRNWHRLLIRSRHRRHSLPRNSRINKNKPSP